MRAKKNGKMHFFSAAFGGPEGTFIFHRWEQKEKKTPTSKRNDEWMNENESRKIMGK